MSGPLVYKVTEAVGPLGFTPVVKQSIDVREIIIDFTRWLDATETLGLLSNFAIQSNPSQSYPSWQTDFPFVTPSTTPPADTNPLYLTGATILAGAKKIIVLVGGGTSRLDYIFSFLATVAPTQRTKEIDVLVSINPPVNSVMISSTTPPTQSVTIVSASVSLPIGTAGSAYVQNGTSAPITVVLPPSPITSQSLDIKDVSGNAGFNPITLTGAAGALIDGQASYIFDQNFQAATLQWTGSQWSVL